MKILKRLVFVVVLVLFAGAIVYIDGTMLPVDHSVSVSGTVAAAPDQVFSRITDIASGANWRHSVKSVSILSPASGPEGPEQHWTEDLGHGQTMTFRAVHTDPPTRREVKLDDPNAKYGGVWIYDLSAGPNPNTTTLQITEAGYIHPPLYRFMMAHIIGPTKNLDQYMSDIQTSFKH